MRGMNGTTRKNAFAAAAAAALLASRAMAMPRDAPRFFGEEQLPAAGFVVPAMQGAKQVPAKPVEVLRYKWTQGDREWFEERSNCDELWRASQWLAAWTDRKGNTIEFARAATKLPPALAGSDVTRDTFERAAADRDNALGPDSSPGELATWAMRFAGFDGDPPGEPETIPVNTSRFAKILSVPLPDPAVRAFLLRLNPHHPGQAKAPRGWFAFVFSFAEAPRPGDRDLDRMLRNDFLGSIRTTGWRDSERAQEALAKRRFASGWAADDIPDDPARSHARDSVALLDDWWYMESPNYILLSDDPAADRMADSMLASLESLLPRYAALVPPFRGRFVSTGIVRVFRKSEDFDRYFADEGTPLGLANTAGLFSGSRRELVIRPPGRRSAQDLGSIVRHEAFHQYLFTAWGGANAPIWFNEGTAELFASYVPKKGGFDFAEIPYHAARLEKMARSKNADWEGMLSQLLLWDQATFYHPPLAHGDASFSYAVGYGIAYFLFRGAPSLRGQPYKDVLPTLFAEMERTGDPRAATAAAFKMGGTSRESEFLRKFARDLRDFWKSESARREARAAKVP